VASHPADARAHAQLGEALLAGGDCEAALSALDHALALQPAAALLQVKRGYALAALRRLPAASEAFDTARSLDSAAVDRFRRSLAAGRGALPDLDPEAIYLARTYERQLACDWSGRDEFLDVFRDSIARVDGPPTERGLLFASLSLPLTSHERLALARAASAHVASGVHAVSHERPATGRLRIGYVSPDFRHHVTARLVSPVLAAHDRDAFEIFAYALGPSDGSALRAAVERAPDTFRDLSGVDDADAARLIARDRLDVLVDLGGYTLGSRTEILAMRPAAVQASWLGFPSTMGADFIDYAFVDRVVATQPEAWHEQPAFLPQTFFVYPPAPAPGPATTRRRDYGLPEDAIVLCAFHHPRKIDPSAFRAWMDVLRAVPRSVLWLTEAETDYIPNLRREAAALGIARERLVSAPREPHDRYMARFALADLFLDAFLYNAASTACDALWMAVPVLTRPGDTPTSRMAASILHAVALPELVTATPGAFVALAVDLANDAPARARVRERVRASHTTSPVFDIPGRARALEAAFRVMVERARRGLPPAPVDAGPGTAPAPGRRHEFVK
jgi:predicted O-linked N-acetylglucosamine transferase (SPINDLY family)